MRMSAGQFASRSPTGGAAQQPGQLGHASVVGVAGLAAVVEHLVPVVWRELADRGPAAVVQIEPDRVVHPPPGCGVALGDVLDQVQGRARAIAGDQQVPPIPCRELRDRLVEHLDVIDRGIGAGVARAQPKRQRFAGTNVRTIAARAENYILYKQFIQFSYSRA